MELMGRMVDPLLLLCLYTQESGNPSPPQPSLKSAKLTTTPSCQTCPRTAPLSRKSSSFLFSCHRCSSKAPLKHQYLIACLLWLQYFPLDLFCSGKHTRLHVAPFSSALLIISCVRHCFFPAVCVATGQPAHAEVGKSGNK